MAGGKLTPRQKMINMMYLVLTALLAMNVSKEVLLAFRSIEVGIENSNKVVEDKIDMLSSTLEAQAGENEKAVPLLALSKEVSASSGELISLIGELKSTLLSEEYAGEDAEKPGQVKNLSDIDAATRLLADAEKPTFRGKELQDKVESTKAKFLEIVGRVEKISPEEVAGLESSLTLNANGYVKDGETKESPWYMQFFQVPATGAMTLLTKIENDALNSEAIVNEFLLNRVSALDFKFDKLRATVQAEKAYLPGGSTYEANIFLTASSSGIVAETYVGSLDLGKFEKDSLGDYIPFNHETESPFNGEPKLVVNGKYSAGTGVGQNSYRGAIKIANPAGGFDWYPFESSYEGAAKGGFSISPTKMNVLYIGLDNPISITIGDAKPGTVSASIGQGSISKSGNGWVARVTSSGTTKITASGVNASTGDRTPANSMDFRVMRVPDPVPTLGGKLKGGRIQGGTLKAQSGIVALLENFPFDARFNVVSYDFILSTKGEILPARGNSGPILGSQVKNLIGRAKPKDYAIFDNIRVKGPDGTTRKLPSLTFEII